MKKIKLLLGVGLLLLTGGAAYAQVPADAPAGTTGLCKDGTYYNGPTKSGACRGHKGVKDWYAAAPAAPAAAAPAAAAAPTAAAPTAAAPASAMSQPAAPVAAPPGKAPAAPVAAPAKTTSTATYTPPANPVPGGGPGLVWVNTSSKVYHCQGDKWYGKTKQGQYLSEADAKAKGNRPDHGKACS
jgi:pyruvate/2-oxoglutarate dehydrogenase complex dihydrolipoamide acyltransferase (E2) component